MVDPRGGHVLPLTSIQFDSVHSGFFVIIITTTEQVQKSWQLNLEGYKSKGNVYISHVAVCLASTKCPTETECWATEKCTKAQRFLTLGTDLAFSVTVIVSSEFPSKILSQKTFPHQVITIDLRQ